MGLKYVKNREEGWIPVVRRKKRTSEISGSSWRVGTWRQVEYKSLKRGIPGIYIHNGRNPRQWLAVKPSPISSKD